MQQSRRWAHLLHHTSYVFVFHFVCLSPHFTFTLMTILQCLFFVDLLRCFPGPGSAGTNLRRAAALSGGTRSAVSFFWLRVAPEDAMDWDGALSLLASLDPMKAGCSARQCLIMLPVAVD